MFFIWDDGNIEHIAKHGMEPHEAEFVVRGAKRPYPKRIDPDKWILRGAGPNGRRTQVIFVFRESSSIDVRRLSLEGREALSQDDDGVYVIHARHLRRGER